MFKIFHCKCCNKKQFQFLIPNFLRKTMYQNNYELCFQKKCNQCNEENIYLYNKKNKNFEIRWKAISNLEEQQILLTQQLNDLENRLENRKMNQSLSSVEEKWFKNKLETTKEQLKKEIDDIKKNIRSTVAIQLKHGHKKSN